MTDEKNIVETIIRHNKGNINVWKILFICFVSIGFIIFLIVSVYNSEWFINQTLQIKKGEDLKLGKNITYSYVNKYEDNRLKSQITIKNVDEKVMELGGNYWNKDDILLTLVFEDKDGFKISELQIPFNDFVKISGVKGQYNIQSSLMIDKTNVRKIKQISSNYMGALDARYADIIKEANNRYRKAINNIFGF